MSCSTRLAQDTYPTVITSGKTVAGHLPKLLVHFRSVLVASEIGLGLRRLAEDAQKRYKFIVTKTEATLHKICA